MGLLERLRRIRAHAPRFELQINKARCPILFSQINNVQLISVGFRVHYTRYLASIGEKIMSDQPKVPAEN